MTPALLALLLVAAPAPRPVPVVLPTAPVAAPLLADEEPPAGWCQGPSSARLAAPITVRFDERFQDFVPVTSAGGGAAEGASDAGAAALRRHALAVARRHFEDARWNAAPGLGREVAIKSVSLTWHPGPYYQVQVVADRVQDGRRLGQATGHGAGTVDRSRDLGRAAWAPGPWGHAARQEATRPRPVEDAPAIHQATVRALDNALLQLAAYWSSEQQVEAARQQQEAALKAAQEAARPAPRPAKKR